MKVLQLCHKPPFPIKDGGCLAINQISQAIMAEGNELGVLSIVTPKHPYESESFPAGYLDQTNFEAIFVDTNLKAVDAFSNLISQDAYHVSRFFSPDVDMAIRRRLTNEQFDLILCESIYVTPYIATIRKYTESPIVLRSHNLEFSIWHRLTKSRKAGLKKAYLKILTRQLKEYEIDILDKIDALVSINPDELKHYRRLGYQGPALTIPFGIKAEEYSPNHVNREPKSVFHLGSMDWIPNQEGIKWFLDEVWPKVIQKEPDLILYLAGRSMPEDLANTEQQGVEVVGEVESARAFMRSKSIMIIPLLSGGGMRVKMIEALALEKCVVSTTMGANGVQVRDGKTALIANSPGDFAKAILKAVGNAQLVDELGSAGRKLVLDSYNSEVLAQRLHKFMKELAR